MPFSHAETPEVDALMSQVACCAIKCVQSYQWCIAALAEAIANRDSFSRTEVLEVIG